ncbi:MAG TPA: ribosome maturation factor RimM [Candidatus Sulfotelmatobacter sp.]|nr:ribosome maturation factor RimM [Candidatus Sulfotelmatobacter sp.]
MVARAGRLARCGHCWLQRDIGRISGISSRSSSKLRELSEENPIADDFITLARVVKTQGRIGEVAVEVHSDVPDRFSVAMKLSALAKSGDSRREVEVEDLWPHKGLLVLKFVGVDSISDAEALIGSELQVPRTDRAELEQGWNYVSDLVGCAVFDHNNRIGQIEDVQFGAGEAPLLIVTGVDGKKYDVPFAEAYLEALDLKEKQVRMNLPEGMLEINSPLTPEEKNQQRSGKR